MNIEQLLDFQIKSYYTRNDMSYMVMPLVPNKEDRHDNLSK